MQTLNDQTHSGLNTEKKLRALNSQLAHLKTEKEQLVEHTERLETVLNEFALQKEQSAR
jgi:hypothetical protein